VSALLPIRFPGPLAEPGVRSTHPALQSVGIAEEHLDPKAAVPLWEVSHETLASAAS
jgi:hypothetical protein